MPAKLDVTVYFDLICPWCLIGKRYLKKALEQFRMARPDVAVSVTWRSHPLLPGTPLQGIPYQEFYEKRLGSAAAVAARRGQVREAALAAGIDFAFERIEVMPNTLAAHQLIDCVAASGSNEQVNMLIERLFTAYFMEGRNIGDPAVLTAIAAGAGFAPDEIASCLESPEQRRRFFEKLTAGGETEVSGVPFFIFNDRLAISGAHPPSSLLAAMQQALQPVTAAQAN
jgi:predicted DsbA family dithiol-disulfide isomerase